MSLLLVEEAVRRLLEGVSPTGAETVMLRDAGGRVLAADLAALRTQPPFRASAMDGYAVRSDEARTGARLQVVGQSRAGQRFAGSMGPNDTVRIFTGAPVPDAADAILIQEDAERDGDRVVVREAVPPGRFVRPAGLDFHAGDVLLRSGRVLDPRALALAASMNLPTVAVRRRPRVAILSTGDELVLPGYEPGPDQIISSNDVALCAFVEACGGEPINLGIAPDNEDAIIETVARAAGADALVTIGGASVGEHDLVKEALAKAGMTLDFWRIAMRPGKPLMVGRLDRTVVLGLPGNPVSALVCAQVFLKPLLRTMLDLPAAQGTVRAVLGTAMPANDGRQDYVRARISATEGEQVAIPFPVQDSSMLATLAEADGLIVRAINAPPGKTGDVVPVLLFRS